MCPCVLETLLINPAILFLNALTVGDGAFSHKIDNVRKLKDTINLEGHPNCITGSRVIAILLKCRILPIGRVAPGRRTRLVRTAPATTGLFNAATFFSF